MRWHDDFSHYSVTSEAKQRNLLILQALEIGE